MVEVWQRWIMLTLWGISIVRIGVEQVFLVYLALGLLTVYLVLAVPSSGRLNRLVLLITGSAATALCVIEGQWQSLFDGLVFALIFTAFLPTLILTRTSLEVGPEVADSRAVFASMPPAYRNNAFVVGSNVMGSVLTLGVLPMLAPLLAANADSVERRTIAQMILRGLALAIAWSPFTVGMAVTLAFYPGLTLWQIVGPGLLATTLGVLLSVLLSGRHAKLVVVWEALSGFRPLLLPLGGAMIAVVSMASLSPFGTIHTIVLAMPLLCWLWVARSNRREVKRVARTTFRSLNRLGGELMLFCGAVALGRVLQESALLERLLNQPLFAQLPTGVILASVLLGGFVLALLGLHSVIIGTCAGVVLSPFATRIADVVGAQAILFGWSCGALLSLSALSVVVAANLFRTSIPDLIFGRNVAFMALYGISLFAVMYSANSWLIG